jgi:hypothetical protein
VGDVLTNIWMITPDISSELDLRFTINLLSEGEPFVPVVRMTGRNIFPVR